MSSYANFFIEIKNKETGVWERLAPYYPFKERDIEGEFCGEYTKREAVPDIEATNGEKLDRMSYIWRQGHVRDMFIPRSFSVCSLADRGLPADLSEGVKQYFDKELANLEEENKAYFNKYGTEKTWGSQKWWYGESYATLTELITELEKQTETWRKGLETAFENRFKKDVLGKKIDEVLSILKNKPLPKRKKEGDDEWDETGEYIGDLFYDIVSLDNFVSIIREFVDTFTHGYYSDDNIRVIVFCD